VTAFFSLTDSPVLANGTVELYVASVVYITLPRSKFTIDFIW